MNKAFFQNKRVVVMGLGQFGGGVDSAAFAARAGARVLVTDKAAADQLASAAEPLAGLPIEYRLGEHRQEDFAAADVVIVNPAVPPEHPLIRLAKANHAMITSQVELFFQMCPAPIVGISGANGKSTTTSLIAHLLAAGIGQTNIPYRRVHLSGNIGNRPLLGLLDVLTAEDVVVLEISSFQLEQLARIQKAPYAAVITNLTPNHLDRHGTFGPIAASRKPCSGFSLATRNIRVCSSLTPRTPLDTTGSQPIGASRRTCIAFCRRRAGVLTGDIQMSRRANRFNLAAALAVASHLGLPPTASPRRWRPFARWIAVAAYRRENGVRWYDDLRPPRRSAPGRTERHRRAENPHRRRL